MTSTRAAGRAQRAIGWLYSRAASRVYEPLVVKGGLRVLGGRANDHVIAQGRRAIAVADGQAILDVPVGTAYFTARIASGHSGLVVGADYAWGMVAAASCRGTPNLAPIQADIHELPFADATFPAILCTYGLQVIPDLEGALSELARVLRLRGVLLFSMVLAPVGVVLPPGLRRKVPTLFRPVDSIVERMTGQGLTVVALKNDRLAYLIEATKI